MVRGLIAYFVGHRTAANILLVLMLALGFGASLQLRAQFFPDVVVENVRVSIQWEGASPRDMDTAVVAVIEPAVAAVEGAEGTLSTSREGEASIRVDFEPGWDMARAVSDVETAVGQILRNLPEGADDPVITRGAWRDRVTDVIISGPVGIEQLTRYSDQFQGLLYREGITRTTVSGVVAPEITVTLQELDLIRHGLTLSDVSGAIAGEVEALPAGDVGDQARLRTGEDRRAADAIAAIPVLVRADGEVLTIGDVATVIDAPLNRDEAYFTGEDPAISIRVDRSAEGDAIAIQQTVQRVADELEATLPQGVTVTLIRTRAEAISDRLDILLSNGLMGLGLVLALLFLFLSPRTAFWVAAGIPVAMTAALALMFAFGLTLNMISLFALIITLGIVVDDAIVVGEHADFRHRSLRETPQEAAGNAAQVMAAPVFSATVTTVIAFSALAVISGRFGELIADIPFTVAVVLIASLVECFLILPNHMRHALAGKDRAAGFSVLRLFGALTVLPVAAGLLFASLASLRFDTVGPMALIGERWDILPFIDAGFVWVGWPFALAAIAAA
ncbi:MAG: efflux RND transporter permease subunit, partial [Rubricella sp.]